MIKIKCKTEVLYEKKWRAVYGNRCNALFLSNLMHDKESMHKLFHLNSSQQKIPLAGVFWEYYIDHDKEKMLDQVEALTVNSNKSSQPFSVDERQGKRILKDWSVFSPLYGGNEESPWADLNNYEKRETATVADEFGCGMSVYYDNKSVAEVLKDSIEKTTFIDKQITKPTDNEKLDLLVNNLQNNSDKPLNIPTYILALREINNDLVAAFKGEKEPLDADAYVPVIIMLDEMSAQVFNQIDYKQQRTFHQSDLGQEMLRFSYLTTQNTGDKDDISNPFSEEKMNEWLKDIKNTDIWQIAQRKITEDIVNGWANPIKVGSLLNNRMIELASLKQQPKESMYADYWNTDKQRMLYMNLYKTK